MDEEKGKWIWGALGLAAGAGLAWWLFKKRGIQPAARKALAQQPATTTPATGTEGMMANYAISNAAKMARPARTTDIVDAEFEVMKDRPGSIIDDGEPEEDNGEF